MHRKGVHVVAIGAALSLVAGVLAANASASTKRGSAGGGEKTEIVIGALGPFNVPSTGTNTQEWPAAVKARVKAANKAKELGPDVTLKVFECNTDLDPNKTEQCARDGVDKGIVASVGWNGTTGANLLPILESAGIPAIGTVPVSPTETSSPVSFPFTSGVPGVFEALPVALGEKDATKQSLVLTNLGAATATAQLFVQDSVDRQGYELGAQVQVEPDQTDFAPVVASATTDDPEGINVFVIGEPAATFIKQLRSSGYKGVLSSGSPFLTESVIKALGDDANGLQVPSLLRWQKSKGGKQFIGEMKKYAKGEAITDLAANYWLSTWVTIELLKQIIDEGGTPDAASLLAAAGQLQDFSTQGMTPPLTTTESPTIDSPFPLQRYYNPTVFMFEIKNGQDDRDGQELPQPVREAVAPSRREPSGPAVRRRPHAGPGRGALPDRPFGRIGCPAPTTVPSSPPEVTVPDFEHQYIGGRWVPSRCSRHHRRRERVDRGGDRARPCGDGRRRRPRRRGGARRSPSGPARPSTTGPPRSNGSTPDSRSARRSSPRRSRRRWARRLKIAQRIQVGLPLMVLGSYSGIVRDYAFESELGNSLVVREPVGVVGAITPWNYPLHQVVAKVAPALAAGCTIVLKPSEVAPLSVFQFAEIVDAAGLPQARSTSCQGTGPVVGEAIAAHPGVDMVSFTGSTRAGAPRRRARGGDGEARRARARRQVGERDPRRRRPRDRRHRGREELLPELRADLHALDPDARPERPAWTRPRRSRSDVAESFRPGDPFSADANLGPLASGRAARPRPCATSARASRRVRRSSPVAPSHPTGSTRATTSGPPCSRTSTRHDDRTRGDLRPGAVDHRVRRRGRRGAHRERHGVRARGRGVVGRP